MKDTNIKTDPSLEKNEKSLRLMNGCTVKYHWSLSKKKYNKYDEYLLTSGIDLKLCFIVLDGKNIEVIDIDGSILYANPVMIKPTELSMLKDFLEQNEIPSISYTDAMDLLKKDFGYIS